MQWKAYLQQQTEQKTNKNLKDYRASKAAQAANQKNLETFITEIGHDIHERVGIQLLIVKQNSKIYCKNRNYLWETRMANLLEESVDENWERE